MTTLTASAWIPPEGVTIHSGRPIPPDLDFFVAPPIEIGRIISAYSTLTTSVQPLAASQRLSRSLLIGVAFAVPAGLFMMLLQVQPFWMALSVGAIAAALTYFVFLVFRHTCSYVGELGIAEYSIKGSRLAQPNAKILCFKDAANLYTSQTRRYRNGVYQGTSFVYTWQKVDRKSFQVSGGYFAPKGLPEDKSNWHFASAAEASWSNHLLRVVNDQFQRLGYIEFPVQQANLQAIRVGYGFLEFVLKDSSTQKVAVADMKDIKLQSGSFYFAHKDARWWSGKGKFGFMYSGLPNAQLFLLCLKQLAGIQWS